MEESKICPYAGLRPFSEEESLYFKGRDEHIEQATKQLGKNKFLILTGASGDGKSSLVYAGIVPNARAGFLKSSFSNWAIADFKPERSPFHNLCKSIANQLGIPQVETVVSELSHGFSALVDLYKASSLYYSEQDQAWKDADAPGKAVIRRKASNLLILADQFEEFFTNPENYHKGVPSTEASLVTNLLLETAQIALEENLPVYVVITMRSDFIGQCAAFRGLPEYIGFSQFFVPRLNRKQLQEVIEEPARLNADKISRRLTERLIHDMVEGTDQLPILQHALNQIWKMAQDGMEEMDLIHYAMVGGMEGKDLPSQDVERFTHWFSSLPEKIRGCYDSPDLQNVLNTHANKLFNQASDYIGDKHNQLISEGDAHRIIETAFRCLTKIDNGRAVRNRMSLSEITAILNLPRLNAKTVGRVLDIFREPGNTLLKPYSMEETAGSRELSEGTVLDLTHESLIRNWEHLGEWAIEEFNNHSTFLDFEQQLNRWIVSGKSSSFLLYIGPLTYFEGWFAKTKPNAGWIARYLQEETTDDIRLTKAQKTLKDANEFLRRSARKHVTTRTIMRYGPKRIAALFALLGLLVLSSFTIRNYMEQRDSYVLEQIEESIVGLINNPKVSLSNKLAPVIRELELGRTTVKGTIARVIDPIDKINIATGLASNLILRSEAAEIPSAELNEALQIADSLLSAFPYPLPKGSPTNVAALTRVLVENNDLAAALELRYYYSRDPGINRLLIKNANRSAALAKFIVTGQPAGFDATTELNVALENALNQSALSKEDIAALIGILSPFKNIRLNDWVQKTYERDKLELRGLFAVYGPRAHGLYQELAYLYASLGDTKLTLSCIDTLLFYNQNYHQNDYANIIDNASNIAVCFYRSGHTDEAKAFVKGYSLRKHIPEIEFYERLQARSKVAFPAIAVLEMDFRINNLYHNTNVEFGNDAQQKFFFEAFLEAIDRTLANPDERNFFHALARKNEGILYAERLKDAGTRPDSLVVKSLFDQALQYFHKISPSFLAENIMIIDVSFPRKVLIAYPDLVSRFHVWEPRSGDLFYANGVFLKYLLSTGAFDEMIRTPADLKNIELWLSQYDFATNVSWFAAVSPLDDQLFEKLEKKLAEKQADKTIDMNVLYLNLGNHLMEAGKKQEAVTQFQKIHTGNLHAFIKGSFRPHGPFSEIAVAAASLFSMDKSSEADKLIKSFPSPVNRGTVYAYAAKEMALQNSTGSLLPALMDSSRIEMSRDEMHNPVPRIQLAYALAMRGKEDDLTEANRVLKNVGEKSPGLVRICRSLSYRGALYEAWQSIPDNISDDSRATYLEEILYGRILAAKTESAFWSRYESRRWKVISESLLYYNGE